MRRNYLLDAADDVFNLLGNFPDASQSTRINILYFCEKLIHPEYLLHLIRNLFQFIKEYFME